MDYHGSIAEIGRIAEPAEQGRILNLNESLSMLLESLQVTASGDSDR